MYDENDSDALRGPRLPEGTYRARGVAGTAELGTTNGGNPQIGAMFEIIDENFAGERVPWYGYFTEKTEKRTLESLRIAGWSNDDIDAIEGFGDTEVDIVVEHNEFEGKVRARVAWVNRPGSGVAMKSPMNESQRKAFAAKMKGKAVQSRQSAAAPKNGALPAKPKKAPVQPAADDDIPF